MVPCAKFNIIEPMWNVNMLYLVCITFEKCLSSSDGEIVNTLKTHCAYIGSIHIFIQAVV